ncbi:MAG TPA: protein kinase [Pyrinomonadaceae bacterium]|nr:protein kinase [Pyrinomonadaceae bacterium]
MKPDRWRQVDKLFEAALEVNPADRPTFLDRACGRDTDLRREIEKMLKFDEQATDFIENDVFNVATSLMTGQSPPVQPGPAGLGKKRPSRSSSSSFTSDSIDDARFIPGKVLSERYRIVGLLGRGGMGEVYRADDLKLKQSVALKFLPETISAAGAALARFYKEVSVARQISHRHVCRVYDVGEYEGQHFISMEFVRGEELSSLIKRIGRLPTNKATDIARQLCAGLAAVHERGVLHRDLKPANIMIDEHGDVRITDFGIAALADEVHGAEAMSGTPAYMSPEQLDGNELTVKSDIYSLGLVLYEVFTGQRAFAASNLAEVLSLRRSDTTPTSPSKHIPDLDPLIERVVLRCLERNPDNRPSSALQIAAALPGGDPLAAALAAGETPSPEMVAAAPKVGGLRPAVAVSLLASFLLMIGTICFLSRHVALYRIVPLNKSPEVLRDRASELVTKLGYTAPPADSAYGMGRDDGYLGHVRDTESSPMRWDKLRSGQPAAIYFWYRQSPYPFDVSGGGEVNERVPARDAPGMTTLTLDTLGRLRSFYAVPPQRMSSSGETTAPDWSTLFVESGLDIARFQPVAPGWTSPHDSTDRAAWEGFYPSQPETKIHVEAGLFEGKPVYFEIIEPWDRSDEQSAVESTRERLLVVLLFGVFITVMLGSAFLTWRNLRLGRGDRKGAFRLAVFVFVTHFLRWLFASHHVASDGEVLNFIAGIQNVVFWAFFFWVVYVAFEPFVRRRWPGRIISWSRLLAGGFRDPLVGRDILIGAVAGVAVILCNFYLADLVPRWFGYPPRVPWLDFPATEFLGIRSFASGILRQVFGGLMQGFILLFLMFLLYLILRKDWLAAIAVWVIGSLALSLTHQTILGVPFASFSVFLIVWVLYRYGLLALIAALFILHLNIFFPITSEFSAWYAGDFVPALIISVGLVAYAFYSSLAGRPLFRGAIPDG